MASANRNPAPGSQPNRPASVLVPVACVVGLVILVIVVAAISDSAEPTKKDAAGGSAETSSLTSGPGKAMSDGSNGGTDDPDLKPIGDAGLKYRDLKVGTGPEVPPGATVKANYAGWLANGSVFDATSKHTPPEPISFSLNGVVAGWTQGIPGMKVGGIRKLVIPSALGYGSRGSPPRIPGGATLIFEVEIVGIN